MAQANPTVPHLPELKTLWHLKRPLLNTHYFSPFAKSLQIFGNIDCDSTCGAAVSARPHFGFVVNTINNSEKLYQQPCGRWPSPSWCPSPGSPGRRCPDPVGMEVAAAPELLAL